MPPHTLPLPRRSTPTHRKYSLLLSLPLATAAFSGIACSSSGDPQATSPVIPQAGSGGSPATGGNPGAGGSVGGNASSGATAIGGQPGASGSDVGVGGNTGTPAADGGAGGAGGAGGGSTSIGGTSTTDPGSDGDGKRIVPQPFKAAPEIAQQSGVPHGSKIKFTMAKGSSPRYPGSGDREVNVYVPKQYVKGMPAPVIVVQDGNNFFGFVDLVSNTLDNLIGANKLPPIVAVFANNGGGDAQGSPRGKEYDTLSGVYAEFLDQEVLPRAEQETLKQLPDQAVTFTKDPEGRGTLGGSSGGVASFIAAWYHPDLFRRVVGFSPSFVAQESPVNPDHPLGAWNFHEDGHDDAGGIIAKTDPLNPIRFWMECGTNDDGAGTEQDLNTEYPYYDFYYAVTRVFEKMTTKGYPHAHIDVGTGAGHVDGGMMRATLPDAMLWVWRGYQGGQ